MPVFDRGSFYPMDAPSLRRPVLGSSASFPRYRTAADRVQPKAVVTALVLKDPPPARAGRAPDCEDSRLAERSAEVSKLLGREPRIDDRGGDNLKSILADAARLAPRRWRPAGETGEPTEAMHVAAMRAALKEPENL